MENINADIHTDSRRKAGCPELGTVCLTAFLSSLILSYDYANDGLTVERVEQVSIFAQNVLDQIQIQSQAIQSILDNFEHFCYSTEKSVEKLLSKNHYGK